MKRWSAYIILTILITNSAGFFVYYAVQLQTIRREMREAMRELPDAALEKITLSQSEYQMIQVEVDEIKYRGRMFDIAKVVPSGDQVILFGLYDEKEDNLIAFIQHIVTQPEYDNSSLPSAVIDFICLEFVADRFELLLATDGSNPGKFLTGYHRSYLSPAVFTPWLPPEL